LEGEKTSHKKRSFGLWLFRGRGGPGSGKGRPHTNEGLKGALVHGHHHPDAGHRGGRRGGGGGPLAHHKGESNGGASGRLGQEGGGSSKRRRVRGVPGGTQDNSRELKGRHKGADVTRGAAAVARARGPGPDTAAVANRSVVGNERQKRSPDWRRNGSTVMHAMRTGNGPGNATQTRDPHGALHCPPPWT